jgi:2'-5' RNA ligase
MRLRFQKLLANLNNLAHSMGTGAFLSAAKADDLKKKYPEQARGIEYLAEQDPTSTKKYLEWSVKMLLTGADFLALAEAVKQYNSLLPRLEGKDRDINSFPSLRDLKDTIEKAKKKETKGDVKKKAKKGGVILYEDDRWMLVHPITINGSIYYGSNTSWCVSRRDKEENYFYTYVAGDNVQFYFLIDKQADQYDEELAQQIGGNQHFSKVAMMFLNGQPYRREPFQDATNRMPRKDQVAEAIGKETFDKLYEIAEEHAWRNKATWAWELLNAVDNEASFNKIYKNNEDEIQYFDMDKYKDLLDSALRCQASEFLVKAVKDAVAMNSRDGDAIIAKIASKGPEEVLFELASSNFQDIKEKIALDPKASERTLLSILKDESGYDAGDWRERLATAVAQNPNVFQYKKVVEALLNFKKDMLSFRKPNGYSYTEQEVKELSQEEKDEHNKELTYEIVPHLMSNSACDNDTFKHGLETIIDITNRYSKSAIDELVGISNNAGYQYDSISKQNLSTIMDYLENGKLKVTDPEEDYTQLCSMFIFREDISGQYSGGKPDLITRLYEYLKAPAIEAVALGKVMPEGDNAFGDVQGPENISYAINQLVTSALTREHTPASLLRDVVKNADKLGLSEGTLREIQDKLNLTDAMNTEERLSAAVEALHTIKASPSVLLAMEEAVELLSAANVGGLDRNHATTVMIPVPKHLAARFPGVEHNNGHEPHLTVCFLSADKDMTAGKASEALAIIRKVCRRQAPFRVALDFNSGLHDFGPSEMGSKALWFDVRQDPNDVLDKLHRAIKNALKLEGIPVDSRHSFHPHVTWRYVSNDQSEGERQRMSAFAASRFNDLTTVWFDVRHLILSMPDGSQKAIALSPRLR